ncbi:hypothetical protein V6N12_053966 [Hibiscus sabdariffa]|uniref:RNase H type-1 domain-containing protein n=1 Tax=Hibiscus sabdariffa TaxID=183260 RepID=A0ABR2D9I3_9ROSI
MDWCIGYGENINIWKEPWLPGPSGGFVRNQSINYNYTRVSDLIDAPTVTWKVDVLEALLDEDHVQRIYAIPLSTSGLHDELVWRYDGAGCYTVSIKSGYRLLREGTPNVSGMSASSSLHLSKFFSELWAITLPAKVKITMWRIVNNFMPTFDNLRGRRLVVGVHYNVPIGELCWKEWVVQTFLTLGVIHMKVLMVTYWAVWYTRNQVFHKGVVPSALCTISFVAAFLCENEMLSPQACPSPLRSHEDWRAPPADMEPIDVSLISPLIADIKDASKVFESISFDFVHREANVVTHTLAQEGKSVNSPTHWIEEAPPKTLLAARIVRSLFKFRVCVAFTRLDP